MEPAQELHELILVSRGEVPDRRPVVGFDRFVQSGEYTLSGRGDATPDLTPVRIRTYATDQLLLFEPIDQPRDPGCLLDHPLGDRQRAEPVGAGAAQNAQDVELLQREVVRLEHDGPAALQPVGGLQNREYDGFLPSSMARHGIMIVVNS